MPRKRFSAEQIIAKLREAEVLQAQGAPIREVVKKLGTRGSKPECGSCQRF